LKAGVCCSGRAIQCECECDSPTSYIGPALMSLGPRGSTSVWNRPLNPDDA